MDAAELLPAQPPAGASGAELVEWAFRKLGDGDPSGIVAIVSDETVARFPDSTRHGRADIARRLEQEIAAIGGWSAELLALASDEGDVLLHWRATGRHTGPLDGAEPTGRPVEKEGITHFVMSAGRAKSVFAVSDRMRFAIQIGMIGAPGSFDDKVFKTIFNARLKARRALRRESLREPPPSNRPSAAPTPPAGASNAELVRWALTRFGNGDPSGIVALTTEETVAHFPEGDYRGTAEIRDRLEEHVDTFEDFALRIIVLAGEGEHVIARWQLTGVHVRPFDGLAATGKPALVDGCEHVVLRDGRITSFTAILDRMQLALALGMMAPAGTRTDRAFKAIFNGRTRLARKLKGSAV